MSNQQLERRCGVGTRKDVEAGSIVTDSDSGGADPERNTETLSDGEIIRRVLDGERDLYRLIIERHKNEIFRLLLRQLRDQTIAEELTQEVFVKAFRGLSGFRGGSKLSTWLVRIAINVSHSFFSSKRYREWRTSVEFNPEQNIKADPADYRNSREDREQLAELEVNARKLQSFVAELKPIYRDVISLCFFEQKSYDEVARTLAIPIGTVSSRISKAFNLLRVRFEEHLNAAQAKSELKERLG